MLELETMCPERETVPENGSGFESWDWSRLKGSELLEILYRLFIQPLRSPEFGDDGLPFLTPPNCSAT